MALGWVLKRPPAGNTASTLAKAKPVKLNHEGFLTKSQVSNFSSGMASSKARKQDVGGSVV